MPDTKAKQRAFWLRLALEGVAVVISILLAFGIDAWWENLREQREEQEILLGLQEEFLQHRDWIATRLEMNSAMWPAIQTLQRVQGAQIRDSAQAVEVISSVRLLSFAGGNAPLLGATLQTLTNSGRLALVRDATLRDELSHWSLLIDRIEGQNGAVSRFVMERLFPRLASLDIPLDEALSPRSSGLAFGDVRVKDPSAYDALGADHEFYNLLAVRRLWLTGTHFNYREAAETTESILRLIEQNLRS